jgi:galactokinase
MEHRRPADEAFPHARWIGVTPNLLHDVEGSIRRMPHPTFQTLFGRPPAVRTQVPGRVNLMGDHTDYNDGLVLPAAIPQQTVAEIALRDDRVVRVWSETYADAGIIEYRLGEEQRQRDWADYVRGITAVLGPAIPGRGFEARIASSVPLGSGLSSSAALEIAVARGLRDLFALALPDVELAKACRRAEHDFVGAPVGIMDQMACMFASERAALFLDTRSMDWRAVPLPPDLGLFVIHSGLAHRHVDGGYVTRRRECEAAAGSLGVTTLRDLGEADLPAIVASLPDPLGRRVRHVCTENQRVVDTIEALEAGDVAAVGRIFNASHASLRDDYEVSIPEVDVLVEAARAHGAFGARITGGGFGGSIVGVCEPSRTLAVARAAGDAYHEQTGRTATIVVPVRS